MPNFDLQSIEQSSTVGTVFYEPSMPSTSDVAKEKLLADPSTELPLLVLCDQQTAGRGQPGKSWESNSHSLTFTWCVDAATLPAANHPMLPLIAGLSVCKAIDSIGNLDSQYVSKAKLKWPNDVLVDRKKVCGILVEKIFSNNQNCFLIGIGVNVSQTANELKLMGGSRPSFPPGSLQMLVDKKVKIQTVLQDVLQQLHANVASENDWAQILSDRFDFIGDPIAFHKPDGEVISGIFRGVDATGRIKIELNDKTLCFASGRLEARQH